MEQLSASIHKHKNVQAYFVRFVDARLKCYEIKKERVQESIFCDMISNAYGID